MKKIYFLLAATLLSVGLWAEGSESMANCEEVYYTTSQTSYTGDNGMTWTTVGRTDYNIGGYKALVVLATVSGNGITGNLNATQKEQGVGTITFYAKGMGAGTGYGDRTFRVTAGNKSIDVVVNIPSMTTSYKIEAQLDIVGASSISISAVPSSSNETAVFGMYNFSWTSFNGKTFAPTFSTDAEFVANGTDTAYYAAENITVNFASETANATFYYTLDGSNPTTSSPSGASVVLPLGTNNLKVIASSAAFGISDISAKVFKVYKGAVFALDGTDISVDGSYSTVKSGLSDYTSKSGLPFYSLTKSKNHIITDAAIHPIGLSFYAYTPNSRDITVSYLKGTVVTEGTENIWQPDGDWTDISTLTNPSEGKLWRYEIALPEQIKGNTVRFKILASGNTVYVDDIVLIAEDIKRAGDAPVIEPVHPTGVTLSQTSATLEEGETVVLTATVAPAGAENKEVTWSTSDAYVATVVNGTVTAVHAGTASITVTTVDGGLTASCAITVNAPEPIHPTGVTLSQTSATLEEGETVVLTATVAPADAENKEVTWSTSDANVATVVNGTVTAVHAGTATITVTTVDGGLTASCAITVNAPEPPQGIDDVEAGKTVRKMIRDGHVFILREQTIYSVDGREVKK